MSKIMVGTAKKSSTVTMADVAREAGVTKMTVSFALNGTGRVSQEMRQTVMEAAQRLGYEPNPHAQSLSNGRAHNTIGLFSLWLDFGVGTQKIQLIQSILNGRGFDVPIFGIGLHNSNDEEVQVAALASIRRQKPRALACFTQRLHPKALLELRRYQEEGGILVAYDYPVDLHCDAVLFDREDNTYQATKHLLELGHRHIGLGDHGKVPHSSPRLHGFRRALAEFGVPFRDDWLLEGHNSRDYAEGGNVLAESYLKLAERPSALCIINDYAALVLMAELERAGVSCPRDISMVGHDDHALSRRSLVPLSTVSHPSEAIAYHVTQFLLSRLSGEYEGPPRQITVRGELIPRQSTASPTSSSLAPDHY
ncbi:HTH-type transcriptional regulator DegA [Abditibacteriota bacterium]|nr:HTH-type transcriptional regulator DegA [Abditibacteriota bacterium]